MDEKISKNTNKKNLPSRNGFNNKTRTSVRNSKIGTGTRNSKVGTGTRNSKIHTGTRVSLVTKMVLNRNNNVATKKTDIGNKNNPSNLHLLKKTSTPKLKRLNQREFRRNNLGVPVDESTQINQKMFRFMGRPHAAHAYARYPKIRTGERDSIEIDEQNSKIRTGERVSIKTGTQKLENSHK